MLKIRKPEKRGHVQFTCWPHGTAFLLVLLRTKFHEFRKFTSDQSRHENYHLHDLRCAG